MTRLASKSKSPNTAVLKLYDFMSVCLLFRRLKVEKVVRSVAGRGKPRCHTFETWLCQDNSQLPTTQGTMRFLTGLLFLVFSLQEILSKDPVAVTKCCPASQIYNSAEKRCVQGAGNFLIYYCQATTQLPSPISPCPHQVNSRYLRDENKSLNIFI